MSQLKNIIAFTALVCFAQSALSEMLVDFNFDDKNIETGPDTYMIFEFSKGEVKLNSNYRFSGNYSVEIRDVINDQKSPEMQGYFPVQELGNITFQFAFMTPTPHEPFNIVLAGTRRFNVGKDGISVWIKNVDGFFAHVVNKETKK